jgi:hypothetical protein
MAGFRLDVFKGIRPRISAKKLQQGEAQTAQNTKLGSGDINVWDDKDAGTAVAKTWYTKTIYRFDNSGTPRWFEWDSVVDVARGPIKDDSLERTYFTGADLDVPKMTFTTIADAGGGGPYPEDDRDLGIPAPPNPLAIGGVALPENITGAGATFSSITCTKFIVDRILYYATYPKGGTETEIWKHDPSIFIPSGEVASTREIWVSFPVRPDSGFRVKRVVDDTTAVIESADSPGQFAKSDFVAYLNNEGVYTEVVNRLTMKETGTGDNATFHAFTIPEATVTFTNNHNLAEGDVIRLSSVVDGTELRLKYTPTSTELWYQQDWVAPTAIVSGEGLNTLYATDGAHMTAAAVEGEATFSLDGSALTYYVDRASSEVSELDDRQYVYTYVSDLGEEGPPSPVSAPAFSLDGRTVTLRGFENVFTHTDLTNRDIDFYRIYRTNSTEAGTEFQFVKEVPVGTSAKPVNEVADNVASADLGAVIETTTWFPPHADMQGIISLPNGMMAGFRGKNVYLCEPFFPHAWPPEYDQAVDYEVVGLSNFGNTLVVLTKGFPYLATGSHPRQMNLKPVKVNFPCSNKKSIASDFSRVYYASPDGLIEVSDSGIKMVTQGYAQKEEWQTFVPSTMVGAFHDGKYFGFHGDVGDSGQGGASAVTQAPTTATLTGTFVSTTVDEDDIQAGGKTIIITLAGTHTWEDAGAAFNATRQGIIDSFDSAQAETNGWDAERTNIPVTDVVRTSGTVVTITLSALTDYEITAAETITCTLPPAVFKATVPTDNIQANVTLSVGTADNFSSKAVFFGAGSSGDGSTMLLGYSSGDADQWALKTSLDPRGTDTLLPTNLFQFLDIVVYDSFRATWIAAARAPAPVTKPVLYTSVDGLTWAPRETLDDVAVSLGTSASPTHMAYYAEYDLLIASWANTYNAGAYTAAYSQDGGSSWKSIEVDVVNQHDALAQEAGFAFLNGEVFAGAWKTNSDEPEFVAQNVGSPGSRWTPEAVTLATGSPTGTIDSIAAGNGHVLYIWVNGSSDVEVSSYNPVTGAHASIGTLTGFTANQAKIVYGNDTFMIVSENGQVSTVAADGSEDTIGNWAAVTSPMPANTDVQNVYYDVGDGSTDGWEWVAVGYNTSTSKGIVLTSDDEGVTWTLRYTTSQNAIIHSMAFNNYQRDEVRR